MTNRTPADLENMISKYRAAALEWGQYQLARDFKGGNPAARVIERLGKTLRLSPEGCQHLAQLMEDPDLHVRIWAAKDCLPSHTQQALAMLDGIAGVKGLLGSAATTTVVEWKAGRLFPHKPNDLAANSN